jgi:hypothetical protein
MDAARALTLFGTTQPVEPPRRLSAGALSCLLDDGALRDVRWGDVEIARGISYLLRDRDWGTVPGAVHDLTVDQAADSFVVRFELRMSGAGGMLRAAARVEGRADGRLAFEIEATPDADVHTNRCGFVVLHPASAAGRALQVLHTNGRVSDAAFPLEISPSQPVLDIRQLSYSPSNGVQLQCRLEAQLPHDPAGKFEMEDQRNWSDASFKTYVASLLDPWPYVLPAGRPLVQRITLTVQGSPPAGAASGVAGSVTIGVPSDARMPQIGIGVPPGLHRARPEELAAMRALGAGWWIVEATLDDPELFADLCAVAAQRAGLPVSVQLDVIVPRGMSPDDAAAGTAALCRRAQLSADALRLLPSEYLKSFQPSDRWPELPPLEDYSEAARRQFPEAQVGGGMFTCFTELNRKRPSGRGLGFIGHATWPIVHAPDDASVMQTLEALPHIVHSVRRLWPGLPYRLGPSTLAMRRNPYGDLPAPNPRRERLALAAVDPRHSGRFAAAWTVGYAAAVAPLGLEVLALHDGHGPSGPLPASPRVVPAWEALSRLARAAGARRVPMEGVPAGVAALAWSPVADRVEILVANVGQEQRRLKWKQPVSTADGASITELTLDAFETKALAIEIPRVPGRDRQNRLP